MFCRPANNNRQNLELYGFASLSLEGRAQLLKPVTKEEKWDALCFMKALSPPVQMGFNPFYLKIIGVLWEMMFEIW